MEAQRHPEGLCLSHRAPSDFRHHSWQREPGWTDSLCLPGGLGTWLRGSGKMLGPRCLVTGRKREVVQRGRQEASAPRLLEKCGLGMAMGHAPASPSSLRTDIYPQSFFVRAGAEDEVCYQEVLSYFASCPLWLPVCAKRQGLDTDWPPHVGQATEVLPCLRNSHLDVEITGE